MRGDARWAIALAASGAVHAAAGLLYFGLYAPAPPDAQDSPVSKLQVDTVDAPRQTASAEQPQGTEAGEARAEGTPVATGAIPQSDAAALPAGAARQPALAATGVAAVAARPDAAAAAALSAAGQAAAPAAARATTARAAPVETATLPAAPAVRDTAPQLAPATERQPALAAAGVAAVAARPDAAAAAALSAAGEVASAATGATTTARTAPLETAGLPAAPMAPDTAPQLSADAPRQAAAQPSGITVAESRPAGTPAAAAAPRGADAPAAAAPAATPAAAGRLTAEALGTRRPTAETVADTAPPAAAAGRVAAAGAVVAPATPDADRAGQPPLPADSATATLAWQFGDRTVTDPRALATIQAFMTPAALDNADANAGQVRDGLASVLRDVDCARLSAVFLPETGTLELRGHVPDPAMQAPLLEALRAQMGDGIPITGNLQHLPEPQCGALGGIAAAGLPQSTDQFTDTRLIGDRSHARSYPYTEGQRLAFDFVAPDYDAFVYVDYFTADGEVIHLVPNRYIPLRHHAAGSVVGVGQEADGEPGLRITIGPPFGQEIAVAFAASRPLYEGLRPLSEPAAPYLAFLRERIADARGADPDFKGEWVYFFISTSPATQ